MESIEIIDMSDENMFSDPQQSGEINYLTKYEYTRLLSARTVQISNGAKPKIDITGIYDAGEIAKRELHARLAPVVVVRHHMDGSTQICDVRHMSIRDF